MLDLNDTAPAKVLEIIVTADKLSENMSHSLYLSHPNFAPGRKYTVSLKTVSGERESISTNTTMTMGE